MSAYRLNEAKELAIYNWASLVLGITTIWDKPNAPRPALPYATLNFSGGGRSEGAPEEIYKTTDTFTYPLRKVITLTVQIFAENSHLAYADTLVNSLSKPTVQDFLRSVGMAIRGHSDPMDISRLLDTKFELRAGIDIFLAYEQDIDDVTGEIQKVSIVEGVFSADGVLDTYTFDLEIDAT